LPITRNRDAVLLPPRLQRRHLELKCISWLHTWPRCPVDASANHYWHREYFLERLGEILSRDEEHLLCWALRKCRIPSIGIAKPTRDKPFPLLQPKIESQDFGDEAFTEGFCRHQTADASNASGLHPAFSAAAMVLS